MLRAPAPLLLVASLLACTAPKPESSAAPIRVPPGQGWVELHILDRHVPADVVPDASGRSRPPPCSIEVDLDGKVLVSSALEPAGSAPPYTVDSTFRVAASPGDRLARVTYSGCRTWEQQLDSREVQIPIAVQAGLVTLLRFDGATLEARTPVSDPSRY